MVKKGLLGLGIVVALFVGLNRLLGISQGHAETIASYGVYPVLVFQKKIIEPIRHWRLRTARKKELIKELDVLSRQRDDLQKDVIQLHALLQYKQATEDMRVFMKRYNAVSAVYAPILLRNLSGRQFFLVDVGETSGIQINMVALYKNVLVGKVVEVYPSYSKVLLISDPACKVAVHCATNGVKGILSGHKKGITVLQYVDNREAVIPGDLLLTTGEGGLFPRGFAVGYIDHVDTAEYDRSIVIKPLIDVATLEYCCIVPNTIVLIQEEKPSFT